MAGTGPPPAPAPPDRHSSSSVLERRMELLEARFVSPAPASLSVSASAATSTANTITAPASSADATSTLASPTGTPTVMASPPPHGFAHSSASRGTPVRSNRQQRQQPQQQQQHPPATTIGFGNNASSIDQGSITSPLGAGSAGGGSGGHSNHSFGFDRPSESSRDALALANGSGNNNNNGNGAAHHQSSSAREASLAAERHMTKIGQQLNIPLPGGRSTITTATGAATITASSIGVPTTTEPPRQQQQQQQQHDCSSSSVPASVVGDGGGDNREGDYSCSSSNQTMITGHHAPHTTLGGAVMVVGEEQHHQQKQEQQEQKQMQLQQPSSSGSKRKSITPSKREPSVKDPTRAAAASGRGGSSSGKKNQKKQGGAGGGIGIGGGSSSPPLRSSNGQTSSTAGGSRKRSAAAAALFSSASRDGSAAGGGGGGGSIQTLLHGGSVGGGGGSSNTSNSKSNPSSSLSSWRTNKVAPPNNTRINDFFASVKKRASTTDGSKTATTAKKKGEIGSSGAGSSRSLKVDDREKKAVEEEASGKHGAASENSSATTAPASVAVSIPNEAMTRELGQYKKRCLELEGALVDRDEKLRAVSNNQTMIHASLRATLDRKEKEIGGLRMEMEQRSTAVSATVEKLVRSDAARQAAELRQKLASDGARLGRIVYTRAGMHSVESWEDGHASRSLKKRRGELMDKRVELEQRQRTAAAVAEEFRAKSTTGRSQDVLADSNLEAVGGIVVQDEFDMMEAEESIRLHLANLKKQEHELDEEERALIAEKEAHIRALKKVASEDSSRFKHRPKLHNRYIPLSQLGKGGFSEVWRAYDLIDMKEVAVKIHQLDPRWSDAKKENYTKHVSREYEIHRGVRHPRIVSLFDVFEIDTNSFATVLECCEGTDLDRILKEKKLLPERDARAILLQILSGMRYLSSASPDGSRQGIIHYDLKPGNILFDKHGDAKITDFGLSKIVDAADSGDSMELTSQGAGTYWYLPPECFLTHQGVRISNKVDVWSIGVIFYQILFGKRPFGDGQSQDHVLSNNIMLNARDVRFPSAPQVSAEAKDFVRQCLTYDQTFRPNISQLCSHPYLLQQEISSAANDG